MPNNQPHKKNVNILLLTKVKNYRAKLDPPGINMGILNFREGIIKLIIESSWDEIKKDRKGRWKSGLTLRSLTES